MDHNGDDMDGLDPAYVVDMSDATGQSLACLGSYINGIQDEEGSHVAITNQNNVHSTPPKRGKGMSLADELAMAMTPLNQEEESDEDDVRVDSDKFANSDDEEGLDDDLSSRVADEDSNQLHNAIEESNAISLAQLVEVDVITPFLTQLQQLSTSDELVVEKLTSQVIKQMYDLARDREAQIRELREMERIISRLPLSADSVGFSSKSGQSRTSTVQDSNANLSKGNEILNTSADDLQESFACLLTLLPRSSSLLSQSNTTNIMEEEEILDQGQHSHTHDPYIEYSESQTNSNSSPLHSLRNMTDDCVSSLEKIHEQTQVTRAMTSNASRKLKALRGAIIGWKMDQQGAEESQAWIEKHETPGQNSKLHTREGVKKFVESQMAGFESDLGRANDEMRAILAKG